MSIANPLISVEARANPEAAHKGAVTTMKTNMLQLSRFVSWSVVGDGYVGRATHNLDAHYSVSRHPDHRDYIEYVAGKLSGLPDCRVSVSEYVRKDNGKEVISLRTTSHPLFSRVRDRQYIAGHRVIDPHGLTMLDWEAAALLFMDDGSTCYNSKGSMIVRLSTCAYSMPEQEALRKAFIDRLGVVWNVNRAGNRWQLNLSGHSRNSWFDGILPFVLPSYYYKLPASLQKGTSRPDDDLV